LSRLEICANGLQRARSRKANRFSDDFIFQLTSEEKGKVALDLFYRKPIINAADVEEALSITTPTANALIKALVELGILVEITGQQRWRTYVFERFLRLFLS
jgi:Fic family protein